MAFGVFNETEGISFPFHRSCLTGSKLAAAMLQVAGKMGSILTAFDNGSFWTPPVMTSILT